MSVELYLVVIDELLLLTNDKLKLIGHPEFDPRAKTRRGIWRPTRYLVATPAIAFARVDGDWAFFFRFPL